MSTNKAVTITGSDFANPTGPIEVKDLPIPSPGDGEVLVKMILCPVNPADFFAILGVYPGYARRTDGPSVLGLEGVGIVESIGSVTSKFKLGDRVVGVPFNTVEEGTGTWQQYIIAKEANLFAVNDSRISDEAAAQFWVNPVTVVGLLDQLNINSAPAGSYIVQSAAGSVLGRQLIQTAKHKGVKTINIVRREALVDELKALGADEVIVSDGDHAGLTDKIKAITGSDGAWGAVECIGGDIFQHVASSVRSGGKAIIYGAMSGLTATFPIVDVLFRGVTIEGFWLVPYIKAKSPEGREKVFKEVESLIASGVVTPYSGEKFSLDDVVAAVKASQEPARGGKVFLKP